MKTLLAKPDVRRLLIKLVTLAIQLLQKQLKQLIVIYSNISFSDSSKIM